MECFRVTESNKLTQFWKVDVIVKISKAKILKGKVHETDRYAAYFKTFISKSFYEIQTVKKSELSLRSLRKTCID